MRRGEAGQKPPARRFLGRTVLTGAAALVLFTLASIDALGRGLVSIAPTLALVVPFWHEKAFVPAVEQRAAAYPAEVAKAYVAAGARDVLKEAPLNAGAMHLLAAAEEAHGVPALARILLSERLSRRDRYSQLYLIQSRVQQGDVTGALRHYDTAMRTSVDMQRMLFPTLATALAQPQVRREFAHIARTEPAWLHAFYFSTLQANGPVADLARAVMASGGMPAAPEFRSLESDLLARLVQQRRLDLAISYYRSLPGSLRPWPPVGGIVDQTTSPRFRPFTWTLSEGADGGASLERRTDRQLQFRLVIGEGAAGTFATRLIGLTPGQRYRISIRTEIVAPQPDARLEWSLRCADQATPFAMWEDASKLVAVPGDCPVQAWQLNAAGGTGEGNFEAVVRDIIVGR